MILAKEVAQRWEEWLFRLYKDDNEHDYLAEQDDIFKSMAEAHIALSASHGTTPTILDYFKFEYDRQKDEYGRIGFLAFKQIVLHIKKEIAKTAAAPAAANIKLTESGMGKARAKSSTASQHTLQQDEPGSLYSGYTPMRRSERIHANSKTRRCVSATDVQHMQADSEATSRHGNAFKAAPILKMPKIDPPRNGLKTARAASTPIIHEPAIESTAFVKNVDIPRMGPPRKNRKVEVVIPYNQSGHRFVKSMPPNQKRHGTEEYASKDVSVDRPATPLKTNVELDNNGVLQSDEEKTLADIDQSLKDMIYRQEQFEKDISAQLNEINAKLDEMMAMLDRKVSSPSHVKAKDDSDDKSNIKIEVSPVKEEEHDEAPGGKRKLKLETDDIVDTQFYTSPKKAKEF